MIKRSGKKAKKAKGKKPQNEGISPAKMEDVKAILQGVESHCLKRDKKSVEGAIKDGLDLIKAEEILFGNGQSKRGSWGQYLKKLDSPLESRTIQRYIQLAKNVDLEKHPTLAYLGQANLLKLIQLGKGKKPTKVLYDGDVDIEFDAEDGEARKQFQSKIKELISKLNAERRESKEEESSSEPGKELVKTLTKMDKLLSDPDELEGFKDFLESDSDLRKKNRSVRVKLRNLAPKPIKTSGKASGKKKVKPKKVAASR
jgi:hypothetical protein